MFRNIYRFFFKNFLINVGNIVFNSANKKKNIRLLKGVIVQNSKFESNVAIHDNSTIINSTIGKYSYVGPNSSVNKTTDGNFCSIGPNLRSAPGIHPYKEKISTSPVFYSPDTAALGTSFVNCSSFSESEPVIIGHDVWIGANVTIMDGVIVGNGAIIGTGAVVTKNLENFSIVGGIPAKKIKMRFSDDKIISIENSQWWNKTDSWIRQNITTFIE